MLSNIIYNNLKLFNDYSTTELDGIALEIKNNTSVVNDTIKFTSKNVEKDFHRLVNYFRKGNIFKYPGNNGRLYTDTLLTINVPLIDNFLYEGSCEIKVIDEIIDNKYIYIY